MRKEDFNLDMYLLENSIKDALETTGDTYLVCFTPNDHYYISDILSDGNNGFVNDLGINFDSANAVDTWYKNQRNETYYNNKYIDIIIFVKKWQRNEFVENEL